VERVRRQISGSVDDYGWDNPTMVKYIDDGIRAIVFEHPESRYVSTVQTSALAEYTALTADIGLTDNYANMLVHFVSGQILSEDAKNVANMKLGNDHLIKTGLGHI